MISAFVFLCLLTLIFVSVAATAADAAPKHRHHAARHTHHVAAAKRAGHRVAPHVPVAAAASENPFLQFGQPVLGSAGAAPRSVVRNFSPVVNHSTAAERIVSAVSSGGSPLLLAAALADSGKTAAQLGLRRTLWCAAAVNKWLRQLGYRGTNSDLARSFLALPEAAPEPGVIVITTRPRGSGHVGIVARFENGRPILVSGNHGNRVGVGYPPGRVLKYVRPA